MERYTPRKGLSVEQIEWAKSHDWYVSHWQLDDGTWKMRVQATCTDSDGDSWIEQAVFSDFVALRAWAGY